MQRALEQLLFLKMIVFVATSVAEIDKCTDHVSDRIFAAARGSLLNAKCLLQHVPFLGNITECTVRIGEVDNDRRNLRRSENIKK